MKDSASIHQDYDGVMHRRRFSITEAVKATITISQMGVNINGGEEDYYLERLMINGKYRETLIHDLRRVNNDKS